MPLPPGFVPPCVPTKAPRPPTGALWPHEIKHDGFRVIALSTATACASTAGPATEALAALSVILEGEAVACDDNGMPCFDRLRHRRHGR